MKKLVLGLSIVLMILISGCVTMSVDSKVNRSGGIEKYNLTMDTNSYIYSMLNKDKPLRESVVSQGGQYKEVWDGNNVKILVSGLGSQNASTEKSENYLIYRDKIGYLGSYKQKGNSETADIVDKATASAIQIHYYLEMPNKIIDSNANYVEDNKAEWHMLNSTSIRDVYAKCEIPSFPLPEIGILGSVSILLITVFLLKRKKSNL
jgi:hypothetical protein